MAFNHHKTKRAAHMLGRSDSGWANPFAHTWRKKQRRDTWSVGDVEAQNGAGDGSGSPMSHTQTAPDQFGRPSGDEENVGSSSKGLESNDAAPSQPSSGKTLYGPNSTTGTSDAQDGGLTRRSTKQQSETGPDHETEHGDEKSKKKKKNSKFLKHVEPKEPFTVRNQLQRTFLNSWINILIIAAPVGIALNFVESINRIVIFVVNFIAIIPLAAMLSFATEEIALRTGETLGGLLNATFGNAVELIVAIIALTQNKTIIVQTSLAGSILSNLLLVMGMCFFFGGLRREKQHFNTVVAQTAASLLALAIAAVIVPTVFDQNTNGQQPRIAQLSRGTAVILLIVYASYLYFQLHTHHEVFAAESKKVPKKASNHTAKKFGHRIMGNKHAAEAENHKHHHSKAKKDGDEHGDDDEHEEPQLHFWVAIATLAVSTVIIAVCAEFMVDGIDAVTTSGGLSPEFVGLILLPIVGNAAEHATAVTVAIKDKMDLAIGVAIGSSMQVALFLIPFVVVIGWGMGNDCMTLSFDTFQVAVLFVSVLLVNYLIGDGESHWLEGMLLMALYIIIAICAFFYETTTDGSCSST